MERKDIATLQGLLRDIGLDPGLVDGLWGTKTKAALYAAAAEARPETPQEMRTSPEGIWAIVLHEGIVPGPYFDSVGVLTYGIGHTAAAGEPNPHAMRRGMPSDLDAGIRDAIRVFRADLAKYEADVRDALPGIDQHEFDAAVSFHVNTGAIREATWAKDLAAGRKADAVKNIMNWRRPPEVIPRREAERDLLASGIYPNGKATVWPVTEAGKVIWRPVRTLTKDELMEMMR